VTRVSSGRGVDLCPDCRVLVRHVERKIIGRRSRDAYASEILGVGDALHTMTVGGHKDGCPLTTIAEMRVLSLDPQLTRYEDEDGWQVGYPVEAVWVRVEYPTRRA